MNTDVTVTHGLSGLSMVVAVSVVLGMGRRQGRSCGRESRTHSTYETGCGCNHIHTQASSLCNADTHK
jgi:hypothetical protein